MLIQIEEEWQPFVSVSVGDPSMQHRNLSGNDFAIYTPTTAKMLTDTPSAGNGVALPASARHAIIVIKDNPIRFRTGGTNPTASVGTWLPVNTVLRISNARAFLEQFRFIDTTAGASEVSVAYFRRPA